MSKKEPSQPQKKIVKVKKKKKEKSKASKDIKDAVETTSVEDNAEKAAKPSEEEKDTSKTKEDTSTSKEEASEDKETEQKPPFSLKKVFDVKQPRVISFKEWWSGNSQTGDGHLDGQTQLAVLGIAMLVYMTQLGFGLWDCWEPHYAETARMMMVRKDWAHPYWSYAFFLSKPILMFWYMAASMTVFGVNEWAIRLPFALHAVFMIWGVYFTISRLFTRRAGILSAIVVGTMPLTTFLGRQAMADIIVCSYMTVGLGFFALAVFGSKQEREKADAEGVSSPLHFPYICFFYFLIGLALLAKGLLGAAIPGLAVVGYIFLTGHWQLLLQIRFFRGVLITLAVALPWYLHMSFFPGRNIDDAKTFFDRFILHDNFYRLFRGVHSDTSDKDHFLYFIRQMGYGMGVWFGLLPIAAFFAGRFRSNKLDNTEKLRRFLFAWWVFALLFFSYSQTKFHHYIFPVLPISGILIALWLDRYLTATDRPVYRFSILIALAITGLVFRDLVNNPHHLVNLFVYMYKRPFPAKDPILLFANVPPQTIFSFIAASTAAFMFSGYVFDDKQNRQYLVGGLCIVAFCFTIYNAHFFMVRLTKHWSQKGMFETLKKDSPLWKKLLSNKLADARKEAVPDEPLIAFRMNWRGEKFYSGNRDIQVISTGSYTKLHDVLHRYRKPGRAVYFLTEAKSIRLSQLKRGIGKEYKKYLKVIDKRSNKYYLSKIVIPKHHKVDRYQIRRDVENRRTWDHWEECRRRCRRWKGNNKRRCVKACTDRRACRWRCRGKYNRYPCERTCNTEKRCSRNCRKSRDSYKCRTNCIKRSKCRTQCKGKRNFSGCLKTCQQRKPKPKRLNFRRSRRPRRTTRPPSRHSWKKLFKQQVHTRSKPTSRPANRR